MTNSSVWGNQFLGLTGSRRVQLVKMDVAEMNPSGPIVDTYAISQVARSISMLGHASVDFFCGLVKKYAEDNNLPELADDADDMQGSIWGMLDGECYALAVVILILDDITLDTVNEIIGGMDAYYSGAVAQTSLQAQQSDSAMPMDD